MPIPRSIQTKNAREKREQTERNTQAWKKHEKSSAWWLNQSWWQWKSTERWHSPLTVIVIAIVGGSDIPRFANAQILWGCSFDVQLNHRTIHKCSLNIKGRQAGIAPLSSYNYFFPSFLPPLAHSLSFPSSLPLSLSPLLLFQATATHKDWRPSIGGVYLAGGRVPLSLSDQEAWTTNTKQEKKECTSNTHAATKRTVIINLEAINLHVYD